MALNGRMAGDELFVAPFQKNHHQGRVCLQRSQSNYIIHYLDLICNWRQLRSSPLFIILHTPCWFRMSLVILDCYRQYMDIELSCWRSLQIFHYTCQKTLVWTIVKDVVCSIWTVFIILIMQVGFFNSCWCRSGELTHSKKSYVDLNPLTDERWYSSWWLWACTPAAALGLIVILIMIVGTDGDNARTLLNRSLNVREQDIIHLNNRRRGLNVQANDMQPADPPIAGNETNQEGIFLRRFNPPQNDSNSTTNVPLLRVTPDGSDNGSIELDPIAPVPSTTNQHPPWTSPHHHLGRPRW